MNVNQTMSPPSMSEYSIDLAKEGKLIVTGSKGTLWVSRGWGAMMRMPSSYMAPPTLKELRRLFWRRLALIVDYVQEPDEYHPANAWLYICTDKSYSLNKLGKGTRSSVKRGFKELKIARLSCDELLKNGSQAFCDTRVRNGLSDGTPDNFRRRYAIRSRCRGHVFLGAWKDSQLAGFLSLIEVDDWLEIEGSFSMNAFLKSYPNDTLLYYLLSYYLTEENRNFICYGVSSIQTDTKAAGLHAFKTKIGFEAKPVHRAFVLHPLLRPFANKLMLWGVRRVLRLKPGNPRLKKIGGLIHLIIGDRVVPEIARKN